MKLSSVLKLVFCVIFSHLAGIVGAIYTIPAIPAWYAGLQKPSFNPPDWIFSPVWLTLFTLMGISLFIVLQKENKKNKDMVKMGIIFFVIQLVLNTFWSVIFFGLNNPFYAFMEIIILWIFILLTIIQFWKISKIASILLMPYILWVSFAAFLNFSLWQLNIGL